MGNFFLEGIQIDIFRVFWNSSDIFRGELNATFPYKKDRGEHNIQVGWRWNLPEFSVVLSWTLCSPASDHQHVSSYPTPRRDCWKANLVHCLKKTVRWISLDIRQLTIFSLYLYFFIASLQENVDLVYVFLEMEKSLTNILTALTDVCHSLRGLEEERDLYSPLTPSRHF